MKIVHLTEAWIGGIATYVSTLLNGQSKSDKFNKIYLIYSQNRTPSGFENKFPKDKKIELISYISSRNPINFYKISKEIDKLLSEINPDIVHLHSTFPGVYGRLIKKFPTIYCAHGWSFFQENSWLKRFVYIQVEKFLAKRTDVILNTSRYESEEARRHKIFAKMNTMISNGVRDVSYSKKELNLDLDNSLINIGFIGRLDYQKGFDIIEPIFRSGEIKKTVLYVIGDSERDTPKKYKDCKNIKYLGSVNSEDLDNYIRMFDIIIVPSRWEGFGLITIDAMRNSKPVIVSNKEPLPEVVINGFNGYVFDIYNAKDELSVIVGSMNKELLLTMGRNARKVYLSNFTKNMFAKKIIDLYKSIQL